jgi:hypothetical protein
VNALDQWRDVHGERYLDEFASAGTALHRAVTLLMVGHDLPTRCALDAAAIALEWAGIYRPPGIDEALYLDLRDEIRDAARCSRQLCQRRLQTRVLPACEALTHAIAKLADADDARRQMCFRVVLGGAA